LKWVRRSGDGLNGHFERNSIIHIPWWQAATVVADGDREWGATDVLTVVVDVLAISDSQFPLVQQLSQLILGLHLG
jgi:hypothetical protein